MKLNDAFAQVIIIGGLAFCGPGLFNALNGLGAVGSGDVKTAAITNGCLYATFSIVGYFAGSIFNKLGPKLSFSLGALCYANYCLCVYYGEKSPVYPAIGGTLLGCGAGLFWCAQMALTLAYSTPKTISTNMSLFWILFNLGGVFGGFLSMGLNWDNLSSENGGLYSLGGVSANPVSYFTFIGIMCLAVVLPWVLLANPEDVIKEDGSHVVVQKAEGFLKELKDAAKGITDPFVVRMMVYFLFSNWFYTYEFNYLNGYFFNTRAQGMNSGLYWAAQMLGATILPFIVDNDKLAIKKRAWGGLFVNIGFLVISWILAFVIQYTSCNGSVDKATNKYVVDFYNYIEPGMAWLPELELEGDQLTLYNEVADGLTADLKLTDGELNCQVYNIMIYSGYLDIGFPTCAVSKGYAKEYYDNYIKDIQTEDIKNEGAKDFPGATTKCLLDVSLGGDSVICSSAKPINIEDAEDALWSGELANGEDLDYGAMAESVNELSQFAKGDIIDLSNTMTRRSLGDMCYVITEDKDQLMDCLNVAMSFAGEYELIADPNDGLLRDILCQRNMGIYDRLGPKTIGSPSSPSYKCITQFKVTTVHPSICLKVKSSSYAKESALVIVDYMFMGISDAIFQLYSLWLIGAASGGDLKISARYASAYKGIQSLGSAVAWWSDIEPKFTYRIQAFVCVAFGIIACTGAGFSISLIDKMSDQLQGPDGMEKMRSSLTGSGLASHSMKKAKETSNSSSSSSGDEEGGAKKSEEKKEEAGGSVELKSKSSSSSDSK